MAMRCDAPGSLVARPALPSRAPSLRYRADARPLIIIASWPLAPRAAASTQDAATPRQAPPRMSRRRGGRGVAGPLRGIHVAGRRLGASTAKAARQRRTHPKPAWTEKPTRDRTSCALPSANLTRGGGFSTMDLPLQATLAAAARSTSDDRAGPSFLLPPSPIPVGLAAENAANPLLPWLALALDIALLVPPVDRRRARGRGRSLGLASASGRGVQRSSPSRYLAQAVACIIGMLDAWARWGVR